MEKLYDANHAGFVFLTAGNSWIKQIFETKMEKKLHNDEPHNLYCHDLVI
jgi:hypothetical protein